MKENDRYIQVLYCIVTTVIFKMSTLLISGLCYGKLEAGILTFIVPTVLLGHLVYCSCILYD